ncbi:MAG: heat-inducible transcription repressor HrcA [Candidatus Omnitrophica bacterium]|nr:heat-inducible transcription repressor HrcA [Candidatus Omnitrophota bacterium]
MDPLTSRQREILKLVIEAYIQTGFPVGSQTLTARFGLNLSSASVRHEMGILEERGYLTHPHTSAGRLPTDKGYHFYVKEIVIEEPLSESLLTFISGQMEARIENLENLMERTSQVLAAIAQEAVLLLSPRLDELYLKELNLIPLDETRLLAVWCTTSGLVQNCLVDMREPISVEEVERIRNFINRELVGKAIRTLEEELLQRIARERDSLRNVYERTLQIVRKGVPMETPPRVFVEGSHYILNQPEFQDIKKFQRLITILEEKSNLIDLLGYPTFEGKIRVAIGAKELSKDIWDCSIVSAPYVWQGKFVGAVGVLGPRRMPYGRIMGLVHHMAERISQALGRWST